jgi:hypothetical protein
VRQIVSAPEPAPEPVPEPAPEPVPEPAPEPEPAHVLVHSACLLVSPATCGYSFSVPFLVSLSLIGWIAGTE